MVKSNKRQESNEFSPEQKQSKKYLELSDFEREVEHIEDPTELRRIYSEFLTRKDQEIESLKRDNAILLRTALKRHNEEKNSENNE